MELLYLVGTIWSILLVTFAMCFDTRRPLSTKLKYKYRVKDDSMNNLKGLDKILYGTMTNSPLLWLGMAINMGISKHAPVYTIEDLYNDTLGKQKKFKWRW